MNFVLFVLFVNLHVYIRFMSLAYLDPGNLEADLQAGAYTGYSLLWVVGLAHFVGFILQTLAARLGAVTGQNLAQLCREKYSKSMYRPLWIMVEIAIMVVMVSMVVMVIIFARVIMISNVIMVKMVFIVAMAIMVVMVIIVTMVVMVMQRPKNLGGRVALPPGKFLRVRKVFARNP